MSLRANTLNTQSVSQNSESNNNSNDSNNNKIMVSSATQNVASSPIEAKKHE